MDSTRFDELARSLGQRRNRRSVMKILGGAALGTAGAVGLRSTANAEPAGKVGICHRTGSESNPYEYITVSANAADAHVAHGDTVTDLTDTANCGACGNVCSAPENATATCGEAGCGFSCNEGFELSESGDSCVAISSAQCWWLQNYPPYQWTPATWAPTEYDCYAENCCGEGLCQSGGGCYQWSDVDPDDA